MAEISRRSFLSGVGILGAAGALGVMTGCAPKVNEEIKVANAAEAAPAFTGDGTEVVLSDGTIWKGTPKEIAEKGGSTMPLEELTRRRKEYVDAQTEFVAEDGTVVPAPYVKMRALIHNLMGTTSFMSVPLNKEVVAEDSILYAYDDVETMIDDHEYLAVQPCSCRYETHVFACHEKGESFPTFAEFCSGECTEYLDDNGDRIETCIAMGDDAEYLVSLGLARRIDKEEAHKLVQRARDDNFILHCLHGREHAWLCMCNPAVCGIISRWSTGAEEIGGWDVLQEMSIGFNHRSHYELEVNLGDCIKCGTCANRCPMEAITMDGEGGSPKVTDHLCQRCGQCAYACPQKVRKLAQRPLDEFVELPHQLEDDNNLKGAYRFEHNLIGLGNTPAHEAYKA